jgi:hypothetical protein
MTEIQQSNLSAKQLHREAMNVVDIALSLKKKLEDDMATEYYKQAYALEVQAAKLTIKEPARTILHKSAALLALEFGGIREAEKLIASSLSEDGPEDLAEELRNLLETINFRRHLKLQGISLSRREFQFSLSGTGVDYGAAPSDAVLKRLIDVRKILVRTAQRQSNIPFDQKPSHSNQSSENLTLYMEVARAQSYAVTLRLGQRQGSDVLFPEVDDFPSKVIDEVLECIDLVDKEDFIALEQRIGQDEYYNNFIALIKNIAPDGDTVSMVGFTAQRNEVEKQVKLSVPRKKIEEKIKSSKITIQTRDKVEIAPQDNQARLRGVLGAADSIKNRHQIRLVGDDNVIYTVIVPRELMADIVRPNFQSYVEITGDWFGEGRIIMKDLRQI